MKMPFYKTDHSKIINEIAQGLSVCGKLKSYLEIGVLRGATFNKVAPKVDGKAVAVDISDNPVKFIQHNKNMIYFNGDTEGFIKAINSGGEIPRQYDMIFLDADHHFRSVKNDFDNVWGLLKTGGLMMFHDVYPYNRYYLDNHCHNCWKIIDHIRNNYDCEVAVLPMYHGIGIARKVRKGTVVDWL